MKCNQPTKLLLAYYQINVTCHIYKSYIFLFFTFSDIIFSIFGVFLSSGHWESSWSVWRGNMDYCCFLHIFSNIWIKKGTSYI